MRTHGRYTDKIDRCRYVKNTIDGVLFVGTAFEGVWGKFSRLPPHYLASVLILVPRIRPTHLTMSRRERLESSRRVGVLYRKRLCVSYPAPSLVLFSLNMTASYALQSTRWHLSYTLSFFFMVKPTRPLVGYASYGAKAYRLFLIREG
jgi:hypothetical protein